MRSKLRHLAFVLPLMAALGVGVPAPALGLELNSAIVADQLTEAFALGRLPDAQVLVHQMAACNLRAIRINGDVYTIIELDNAISTVASGGVATVPSRPQGAVVFLDETYQKKTGVVCGSEEIESVTVAVAAPAPVAPPAPPPPAAGPPTPPPTLDELCAPFEPLSIPCPADPDSNLTPEQIASACALVFLDPCPFLPDSEAPTPPAGGLPAPTNTVCLPFEAADVPCPYNPDEGPLTPQQLANICDAVGLDPCPFVPGVVPTPPAPPDPGSVPGVGSGPVAYGQPPSPDDTPAELACKLANLGCPVSVAAADSAGAAAPAGAGLPSTNQASAASPAPQPSPTLPGVVNSVPEVVDNVLGLLNL